MSTLGTHPFPTPDDPLRRLRGRLGGRVTLWTAADGDRRAGLTVTSLMVAGGVPGRVLALVDPDSDLADVVRGTGRCVCQLLEWAQRDVAEAFAGQMPAPGGPFRLASWRSTDWGPLMTGASVWAGLAVEDVREVGFSLLVQAVAAHVEVGGVEDPLMHRRGRYERALPPGSGSGRG